MIDKEQLMQVAQSNPKIQQAVDAIEQRIGQVPPEMIADIIHVLELALEDPSQYPKIRQMAIERGFADEQSIPQQFDPTFVVSLLVAFYELEARSQRPQMAPTGTMPGFAQGGLARHAQQLQRMGRGSDTMLAHINPREAAVLARMGGSGTVNPNTGLAEFKGGGIGGILSAVLPIAINFIAPGMGTALGGMFGATGLGASMLGGAMIGGATSALGGGDFLKGAALGGLGGGAGGWLGGQANSALGLGLGEAGQAALGSGLVGGAMGAASGQGFAQGAMQGAAGQYLGSKFGQMGGSGAVGTGMAEAGKNFGNMMAAGYDPRTAAIGGGLSGIAAGLMNRQSGLPKSPSETVLGGLKMGGSMEGLSTPEVAGSGMTGGGLDPYSLTNTITDPAAANYELTGTPTAAGGLNAVKADIAPTVGQAPTAAAATPTGGLSSLLGGDNMPMKVMAGMQLLGALQGAPEPVQQAVATMSPAQQEYFNRPSITWNWDQIQKDAAAAGQDLSSYMAQNWNKVTAGTYNNPTPPKLARGGALNAMAMGGRSDKIDAKYMSGGSLGQADQIDAKLSDGEFVIPADVVAHLGDGNNRAGALKLYKLMSSVRTQKGASAKRLPPKSKSAESYL